MTNTTEIMFKGECRIEIDRDADAVPVLDIVRAMNLIDMRFETWESDNKDKRLTLVFIFQK